MFHVQEPTLVLSLQVITSRPLSSVSSECCKVTFASCVLCRASYPDNLPEKLACFTSMMFQSPEFSPYACPLHSAGSLAGTPIIVWTPIMETNTDIKATILFSPLTCSSCFSPIYRPVNMPHKSWDFPQTNDFFRFPKQSEVGFIRENNCAPTLCCPLNFLQISGVSLNVEASLLSLDASLWLQTHSCLLTSGTMTQPHSEGGGDPGAPSC